MIEKTSVLEHGHDRNPERKPKIPEHDQERQRNGTSRDKLPDIQCRAAVFPDRKDKRHDAHKNIGLEGEELERAKLCGFQRHFLPVHKLKPREHDDRAKNHQDEDHNIQDG